MIKKLLLLLLCHMMLFAAFAQNVTISVNATQNKRLISPNIYGRNQSFDSPDQFYKDAGVRFARIGGGNNMSAYNWRAKLTVHPDWFNNVYGADWDVQAQKVNDDFPNMHGMFAFQLLGRAASSGQHNFPDWNYMQAHPGWFGNHQNLAGDGTANPDANAPALVEGNKDLFSKPWPADSVVGILDHWFGASGLGLNKNKFAYWSMDNEVDVWNGTHDWAMPTLISAAAFMDRYIELAKKAKAIYPGIKLCGPVTTSEWQWYKWSSESIWINGRYYPWIEYFIKRLGDEYKATGIKLVDVIDIHNYPYYNNNVEALQGHRIYYDTTYDYPGSNGLKSSTGGWDNSLTKQYLFKRFDGWLNEHFGANHGITCGVSEWSPGPDEPNLASVIYGSHLGTFANNGVDLFTPWSWFTGMWETLHLFSKNAKEYSVLSTSSDENMVSAYTTVNAASDSITVIIVNRDMTSARNVTVNLSGINVDNGIYQTLQLSSLPATETFISDDVNALKKNAIMINTNSFTVSVPALSTTAVLLKAQPGTLPITLLNFSGKENSSGYRVLNWDALELNMSTYIIERSFDGKNFIGISATKAKNGSPEKYAYSYTDSSYIDPAFKKVFYRLNMVGASETGQRSKTVLINLKSHEAKIKIYPQPGSSAGITVEFVNNAGGPKEIILMDALGHKIRTWHNYTASQLFLSGLKTGVYLIKEGSTNSENKTINKFIIQ